MFTKHRFGLIMVLLGVVATLLVACSGGGTADPGVSLNASPNAAVSFSKDIKPILDNTCINCHGVEKVSKGLDLTTYDKLMAGSQNGAVIVAKDANNSKLVQSILTGKMPKRGPKLSAAQIQLIVDWVNAGAPNN